MQFSCDAKACRNEEANPLSKVKRIVEDRTQPMPELDQRYRRVHIASIESTTELEFVSMFVLATLVVFESKISSNHGCL